MNTKNIIVENIKVTYSEGLVILYQEGTKKKYNDPSVYFKNSLENSILENQPFHYFICWLQKRYMRIFEVENVPDKKDPNKISQSIFHIKNSFDKTAKVVVDWDNPISKKQIKRYEKANGNSFKNNERNLYINKIIKNIIVSK
ncbi:hypothetical protein HIO71_13535 [Chryseobacterium aquaticum]|uniref:Uncharacterized protein n=1 Tax=Chryseobacterium aquaticum TaxID=452084 RepID=A0A848N287_9FLAO|nr:MULTISPECIES: hypothetical protein [Chryseobacterium]NMR35207.1 hypothetical protein [Chryseobacterium aquaticum]NRQ47356.1 hypothetical protein [Chryseobacterium sp. C-204]